jgi:phosphate starvation-inducible protein PhoH and related proteins
MKPKRQPRNSRAAKSDDLLPFPYPAPKTEKVLRAKTETQSLYIKLINGNVLTFGLGPAGTGKTFIAAWLAAEALESGDCKKLYITRPAIEAGESIGFLPGEMEDKIGPYFAPVREALERRLGKGQTEYMLKSGKIEFVPLAFMRGRTFDDSWVIADEMQNATPKQMKMLLTRVGRNTKLIVNGDLKQSDIPGTNGLYDAKDRLRGLGGIAFCTFGREDVVRSGLARIIVDAYEGEADDQTLPLFLTKPLDRSPSSE